MLTASQIDALRWIDRFPHNRARWLRKGKLAYGDPKHWDAIELSGERGSIRISTEDWDATKHLRRIPGADESGMFRLNEAGRAKLAAAEGTQS